MMKHKLDESPTHNILVLECPKAQLFIPFFFLRQGLILSPRLECSGAILTHCNLRLLDSSDPSGPASPVTGTMDVHHHAWLIFVFLVGIGFYHVGQAGL